MSDTANSAKKPITLRYFAWVREKAGVSEEQMILPDNLATVADLLAWQHARGDGFAAAFAIPDAIRVAVDHAHVRRDALIINAREIAFFPPVTGG